MVRFELTALDEATLVPQVAHALEARVEHYSREKLPGLWEKIDRIASQPGAKRAVKPSRFVSAGFILLGVVLFVAGYVEPRQKSLMFIGTVAILYAILRLVPKSNRYEREAASLLRGKSELEPGHIRIELGDAMVVTVDDAVETVKRDSLELVLEEADVFVVCFGGRAVVLQKRDLAEGTLADAREWFGLESEAANVEISD